MTKLLKSFIEEFKDKYNLETFVETGCYLGEALHEANQLDMKLYSCDIRKEFTEDCSKLFPNAIILHCDSVAALQGFINEPLGRTFFWLDAHYPSNYGGRDTDETKMPLLRELQIIKEKDGIEHDVIVCDDISNIADPDNACYDSNVHEYFKVTDVKIKDLVDVLKDTHHATMIANIIDGLLIFEPK